MRQVGTFGVFAILFAAHSALSADITIQQREPLGLAEITAGGCTLWLKGEITAGDTDRLQAAFKTVEPGYISTTLIFNSRESDDQLTSHTLCLDSGGGSFEEANRLIRFIQSAPLITVVPEDATCLSACANVFLAGTQRASNSDGPDAINTPYRVLHVRGRLGFHGPYPKLPQTLVPGDVIAEYFRTALVAIRDLNSVFENATYQATERFPRDLMLAMLSKYGASSFYFIDTVDKAGRFDIHLAGVPDIEMDAESMLRMCSNAIGWMWGVHSSFESDLYSWNFGEGLEDNVKIDAAHPEQFKSTYIEARHYNCTISTARYDPGDDYIVTMQHILGNGGVRYMEPWQSLPHYVYIHDIASSRAGLNGSLFRSVSPFETSGGRSDDPIAPTPYRGLRPGHSLVLSDFDQDGDSRSIAINLISDTVSTILWPDGRLEVLLYNNTPDGLCFTPVKPANQSFCGHYHWDDNHSLVWAFDNSDRKGGVVSFEHPGWIEGDEADLDLTLKTGEGRDVRDAAASYFAGNYPTETVLSAERIAEHRADLSELQDADACRSVLGLETAALAAARDREEQRGVDLVGRDLFQRLSKALSEAARPEPEFPQSEGSCVEGVESAMRLTRENVELSGGPSFSCGSTSNLNPTEKTICATPKLWFFDTALSRSYLSAKEKAAGDQEQLDGLKSGQRSWIRDRNSCVDDVECIMSAYEFQLRVYLE